MPTPRRAWTILNFAVLGLGDKNYSDFCGASKKFDARLEALGAKRLAPRGECDADYETAAKNWIDGLWRKVGRPGAEFRNGTRMAARRQRQLTTGANDGTLTNQIRSRRGC